MKYDLFDLFSEYEGELPETKEKSCDTERIRQLVTEKTPKIDAGPQRAIISAGKSIDTDSEYSDEVKGVDIYMRPKWFKSVMTAVVCCLLVVGLFGGAFILKRNSAKNKEVQAESQGISVPATNAQGRTVLTVGMPCYNHMICDMINTYNSSQSNYKIDILCYSEKTGRSPQEYTKDNCREEMDRMKMDILGGDAPDMLALSSYDMLPYVRIGMFVDMYELMDSSVGMKREDFLPNVLDGFEIDGEIPAITSNFRIKTAVAKTKFVGENSENWTMDKFIEVVKKLPENMQVLNSMAPDNAQEMYDYLVRVLINESMDMKNSECDFDTSSLKKAIEYSLTLPDRNRVFDIYNSDNSDGFQEKMKNDGSLINNITISGLGQSDGNSVWMFTGEDDITFVGSPSDNGFGAYAYCDWLWGITKSSDYPEIAWTVISDMLTNEKYQSDSFVSSMGVPTAKIALDRLHNQRDSSDFHTIYYSYIGDDPENGKKITQERVDQLYNYIQTVKIYPYRDLELEGIIREEAQYVLSGERSIDHFIEIINDRIGTYMAESK